MGRKINLIIATIATTSALATTGAFANCILTDVEVEVITPTDAGIQEIEVDVTSSNQQTANATFYLRKGEKDVFNPNLGGQSFDIQVTEIDKYKSDKFPRIRAGCASGSQVIRYGLARFNLFWTVF